MLTRDERLHYTSIVNNNNCHLRSETQNEIIDIIEKSDFELLKQRELNGERSIKLKGAQEKTTSQKLYIKQFEKEINGIFNKLRDDLDKASQALMKNIRKTIEELNNVEINRQR